MVYHIEDISELTGGKIILQSAATAAIKNIVYDTRKISFPQQSIFVALKGKVDGHNCIAAAYNKGIRHFLISKNIDLSLFPDATVIHCEDVLSSLQSWARKHRTQLDIPIIAISGSNGKTIVKEWLHIALNQKYQVGKSPLSYNSQLGVALSLTQLDRQLDLAIIEAGISQTGEMSSLAQMIRPQVGILTNIAAAHSSGFADKEEKLKEKLLLFQQVDLLIYNRDQPLVSTVLVSQPELNTLSWGHDDASDIQILTQNPKDHITEISLRYGERKYNFTLPFTNQIMIENCLHVVSYLIWDKWKESEIQKSIHHFSPLPNRLEVKQGVYNSLILDDSYSSDPAAMHIALENLEQLAGEKEKIVLLTPYEQQKNQEPYEALSALLREKKVSRVIGIGFSAKQQAVLNSAEHYTSVTSFLSLLDPLSLADKVVLIKGARKYALDKISAALSEQVHQTCLETNLSAITHNLNFYKSKLRPETKIMAVVKAEAYGSGSDQMTTFLQSQQVDYLAVALVDEGIRLRKQNCSLPLMIFNVQENNLEQLWEYELEPEVYSFSILYQLLKVAQAQTSPLKIHLKLDSGMRRLGFLEEDLPQLIQLLREQKYLHVTSVFSHLASSESAVDDSFTQEQFELFDKLYDRLATALDIRPLKHMLNTAGIVRFPGQQYDMVRLGLGMYGIDESGLVQQELEKGHTLKAKVIQIKPLAKGETTGYNRKGSNTNDTMIAIVSIGYADGLMRSAGNGQHHFTIQDRSYPTIGNICMDVMMLDIGKNSGVNIGDEVIIFGTKPSIESLATSCNTITYEIISRIAPRVKRTYIYD